MPMRPRTAAVSETDMREERLQATTGFEGRPGLRLSSWRGRSGRRYVVGIHTLDPDLDDRLCEMGEAVMLAVRRDAAGTACLVAVAAPGETPREALARHFVRRAGEGGATELHVHRLAETAAQRRAVAADLGCLGEA